MHEAISEVEKPGRSGPVVVEVMSSLSCGFGESDVFLSTGVSSFIASALTRPHGLASVSDEKQNHSKCN
jgi:hypothetical protein